MTSWPAMRETEFWERMRAALGDGYARVWADQHQMAGLDHRSVTEALAAGIDCKQIWRVVAAELELSSSDS